MKFGVVRFPGSCDDVDDAAQLDDMCRRLLANPLIEDYEILSA